MIERSDLGAKGDGKLVTVTDYDGLGRVRLVRSYEGDAPSLPPWARPRPPMTGNTPP